MEGNSTLQLGQQETKYKFCILQKETSLVKWYNRSDGFHWRYWKKGRRTDIIFVGVQRKVLGFNIQTWLLEKSSC